MAITVWAVSYDCADADKLSSFWSSVLGRPVNPGASAEFAALGGDGNGLVLAFHQVPEAKTVKNRLHLDLVTTDFDTDTDRLPALGATRLRDSEQNGAKWITFADPEGNEFDLIRG